MVTVRYKGHKIHIDPTRPIHELDDKLADFYRSLGDPLDEAIAKGEDMALSLVARHG